jgi:23S rRNA pseudouridine1911/1915/1917 synthase
VSKPAHIALPNGLIIPILYEDAAVLAIDKPADWILAPERWTHTRRNLQLALCSAILAGDFWARARNLKFLRFIHRLDAETSGVLLLAKSHGALRSYSRLFESRRVEKIYLAVVEGIPAQTAWTCRLKISPHPQQPGRMQADAIRGQEAETTFRILQTRHLTALVEARPLTGRTHQIRVHLAALGHPVLNEPLYGPAKKGGIGCLALRAIALAYTDPFRQKPVRIAAPHAEFTQQYGFEQSQYCPWRRKRGSAA